MHRFTHNVDAFYSLGNTINSPCHTFALQDSILVYRLAVLHVKRHAKGKLMRNIKKKTPREFKTESPLVKSEPKTHETKG